MMNRVEIFVLSLIIICMMSCHDTISHVNKCPLDIERGQMSAYVNNELWEPCPYAKETSIIFIEGASYDFQAGILIRLFSIILPEKNGRFIVTNHETFIDSAAIIFWNEVDYDVLRAVYAPRSNRQDEYVHVTHYDSLTGRIVGTFAFTVFLGPNDGYEIYPDSLVITNGFFDTYFIE